MGTARGGAPAGHGAGRRNERSLVCWSWDQATGVTSASFAAGGRRTETEDTRWSKMEKGGWQVEEGEDRTQKINRMEKTEKKTGRKGGEEI